jgi:hypothetical protein
MAYTANKNSAKDTPDTRATVQAFWHSAVARDWNSFAGLLHPEIVYEVPQTRERVRGRDNYTEFNRCYPGDWTLEVRSLVVDGDEAVTRVAFTVDGQCATGITFFSLRDDLIDKIIDYWPESYEPPKRLSAGVERY